MAATIHNHFMKPSHFNAAVSLEVRRLCMQYKLATFKNKRQRKL